MIFETNIANIPRTPGMTAFAFVVNFLLCILGGAAGFYISYGIYKFLKSELLLSWCKHILPQETVGIIVLYLRAIGTFVSAVGRVFK